MGNYETTKPKDAGLQFFESYMLAFVTTSDTQMIFYSNLASVASRPSNKDQNTLKSGIRGGEKQAAFTRN